MTSMRTNDKVRRVLYLSSILDTQPSRGSRVFEKKYLLKQTESKKYLIEPLKQQISTTIYDFFVNAVEQLPPIVPTQLDESFHLQEDIIMMIEISPYTVVNDQAFEYLSKLKSLKRSKYSIAERYQKHMIKLSEENIGQMCKWIEKFGVAGFARFQGDQFIISLFDQAKNKSFTVQTEDESKEINEERGIKKKVVKYSNIKQGMFEDIEHLQKVLNIYSVMVHKPISYLLKILNQTSGDFCDLDHYLQTGDKRVLWTQEQDKILHFQVSDKSELSYYRSSQSINKRKRYLGIF